MISTKRLVVLTRKWLKMTRIGRRRMSLLSDQSRNNIAVTEKGHFVVYSMEKRRFVIPLVYLSSPIFRELFRLSEEEFGLPRDGPITLPCDAALLEYLVSVVKQKVPTDFEKELVMAVASTSQCLTSRSINFQGFDQRQTTVSGC